MIGLNDITTPMEDLAALTVGHVESVSPSEIRVKLTADSPQATALNTGAPRAFPRINTPLLLPNETGAVVGLISWMGTERAPSPTGGGPPDPHIVDLPQARRSLSLVPVGTLSLEYCDGEDTYVLERGIAAFPSVGEPVVLPSAKQLRGILQACKSEDCRVCIGNSPLSDDIPITVDPDKLFGRHLAVLGNTGSGKSCSVAGMIRWCMEAVQRHAGDETEDFRPNARFIVLDVNGEYRDAFADWPGTEIFSLSPQDASQRLTVPGWMWNSEEWAAFSSAAPGVQRPLLHQALRDLRSGSRLEEPAERQAVRCIRSYGTSLRALIARGPGGYAEFPGSKNCGHLLNCLAEDSELHASKSPEGQLPEALSELSNAARGLAQEHHWTSASSEGYNPFSETQLRGLLEQVDLALSCASGIDDSAVVSEDAPVEFELEALPDHLDQIAASAPSTRAAEFVATLTMRIRMMLQDRRLGPAVSPPEDFAQDLATWLSRYVGSDGGSESPLTILDLSLVPSDILQTVVTVVGRVVFEAVQRYRKLSGMELPTVMVLEEAHRFVRRGIEEGEGGPTPQQVCRRTFERIAREGRKFGLGLVLSSQRPSELSPTVLAQCNTFLLHRIVNDRDQELLARLVPDNLAGLLEELPALPTRQAFLIGWATSLPKLVEMNELPEDARPRSDDPHFWDVWTGRARRDLDWGEVVQDWTGVADVSGDDDPDDV